MAVEDDNDYVEVLKNAGVPLTDDEVRAQFNAEVEDEDSYINNDSNFSPFWRLVENIITLPYFWLLDFLVNTVFPQSFLKDATGAFLDLYLWSVSLERKQASRALGTVIFERELTAPELTLDAGFIISSTRINGVVYQLRILADVILLAGVQNTTVDCEAVKVGAAYNLAGGYYKIPQTPLPGLIRVYNPDDWLTLPGADKESNEDARERYRAQFMSVSGWFIDDKYKLIMSEFGGVTVDQIYIEHGGPRGPGSANAYILLDSGVPSQPFLDSINQAVRDDGYHGLGDDMLALDLPDSPQDIIFDVLPVANLTDEQQLALQSNVIQFIRCAYRENQAYTEVSLTWPQALFSYSTLNQELRNEFVNIDTLYTTNLDYYTGLEIGRINSLAVNLQVRPGS